LPVSDIDLATMLVPTIVIPLLVQAGIKAIPTGLAHGTITAVIDSKHFEVTTLRRDVETNGRHAVVAYATDWQQDAARRDFTINALYLSTAGEVFDYFGGLADLAHRRVRFIGNADTRIREDALRILRFFRFQARYGDGNPDAQSYTACVERRNDLMALSRERIRDEILKLLATENPAPVIKSMLSGGIFDPVVPEISSADRLQRLVEVELQVGDVALLRRLASLLPVDVCVVKDVAKRLKMSLVDQRRITAMILPLAPPGADDQLSEKSLHIEIYKRGTQAVVDAIMLAAYPDAVPMALLDMAKCWVPPKFPVSGQTFIERGVKVGPDVSTHLRRFEQLWLDHDFTMKSDKLSQLVESSILQG
jgi:poly(A) polymerase